MKMSLPRFLGIPFFLALLMSLPAAATTLERMSVARMARTAPLIVHARCLKTFTAWEAGEIWTFTSLETQEVWKGSASARLTVRLISGRFGNLDSRVPGVPRFEPGEEVVLFLEPTPRGDFSILSWAQGSFRIHRDPGGAEVRITQDTASFPTFDPLTRRFETNGIRRWPLSRFRAAVAEALRGSPGAKP